jgi:AcrR family transcriptional regulator
VGRHGLEAVSMDIIIAESGRSTGAVYRHFKGQDQVVVAAEVWCSIGQPPAALINSPFRR